LTQEDSLLNAKILMYNGEEALKRMAFTIQVKKSPCKNFEVLKFGGIPASGNMNFIRGNWQPNKIPRT